MAGWDSKRSATWVSGRLAGLGIVKAARSDGPLFDPARKVAIEMRS